MAKWIKWWKDKTFLAVMSVALVTMLLGFLMTYYISWGWIITVFIGAIGGLMIRKIVVNRLKERLNSPSEVKE